MKLYYSKGACSLTQHILLEMSGLSFEVEAVNLKTKVTASGKDFCEINPRGQVPTLVLDDGTVLVENVAIAQYIADSAPQKELIAPVNQIDRYKTLSWLSYVATDLHKTYGPLFQSNDESIKEKALASLDLKLAALDKRLAEHQYIATDKFTIADSYLFVVLSWRKIFKTLPDYENIDRYCSNIESFSAVKKAIAAEV